MSKVDLSDLISIKQAAEIRNTSVQAVAGLIRKGRFKVFQVGGHRLLLRKEVEAYVDRKPGRPEGT